MSQRDCFDWPTIQKFNKKALEKLRPYVGDKLVEKFKYRDEYSNGKLNEPWRHWTKNLKLISFTLGP